MAKGNTKQNEEEGEDIPVPVVCINDDQEVEQVTSTNWICVRKENEELEDFGEIDATTKLLTMVSNRFVESKSCFHEVREAVVKPIHFVRETACKLLSSLSADSPAPSKAEIDTILSKLLIQHTIERFEMPVESIHTAKASATSQTITHFLCSQSMIQIPFNIKPSLFLENKKLRTMSLKRVIEETVSRNKKTIYTLTPQLSDNFVSERKKIISTISPLECCNQRLNELLRQWDLEDSLAPGPDDDSLFLLEDIYINKSCIIEEKDTFQALLECENVKKLLSRLLQLRAWSGVNLFDLHELNDNSLIPYRKTVKRFRFFADILENYLFEEDSDNNAALLPYCTLRTLYLKKEQMECLIQLHQERLDQDPLDKEEEINLRAMLVAELVFMKDVVSHWKKRSKLIEKHDCWSIHLLLREKREEMKEMELDLFLCKLTDLYLFIYEAQLEFDEKVAKEMVQLEQKLRLGVELGVWSSISQHHELEELRSLSLEQIFMMEQHEDLLSNNKRLSRIASKHRAARIELDQLDATEETIPAMELQISTMDQAKLRSVVAHYKMKASDKKLKKRKIEELSEYIMKLEELDKSWRKKKKWTASNGISAIKTLPRVCALKEFSALELSLVAKKKKSVRRKLTLLGKIEALAKDVECELEEEIKRREEVVSLLRSFEQLTFPNIPKLFIHLEQIPYLQLHQIAAVPLCTENVNFVVSLWIELAPFVPSASILPLIEKQCDEYPEEKNQIIGALEGEGGAQGESKVFSGEPFLPTISNPILSTSEIQGLIILSQALHVIKETKDIDITRQLSDSHQHKLLDFLVHIENNSTFNSITSKIDKKCIPFGISSSALSYSRKYSYKSKHLNVLHEYATKFANALSKSLLEENLPSSGKMTLQELGILRTMERWSFDLCEVFRVFHQQDHPMYTKLEQVAQASIELGRSYALCNEQINKDLTYQSGDLLLAIWSKKVKTMQGNRPPQSFSLLMAFTKYEHTAMLYRNECADAGPVGELRLSHMFRTYHDSELTLEDIATSSFFRVQVASFVKEANMRSLLAQKLGEEWEDIIQKKYQHIQTLFHFDKQKSLEAITNPLSRVMNIGVASVMPWTRYGRTIHFEDIKDKLDASEESVQMTCSEFAAKTIISVVFLLDAELVSELAVEEKVNSLYFFSLPFGKREKFKTMQPERLRHLLSRSLEQIPHPAFISRLIE